MLENRDRRSPRRGSSPSPVPKTGAPRPTRTAPGSFAPRLLAAAPRSCRHRFVGWEFQPAILERRKARARLGLKCRIELGGYPSGTLCEARQHVAPVIDAQGVSVSYA